MKAAIFLDRDGTLNKSIWRNGKPTPPYSYSEVELISGTQEAISKLRKLNYIPVIITNQPDVSRGKVSVEEVNRINDVICEMLEIDYLYMCAHDDKDNCECRKPKPGMINELVAVSGIVDKSRIFFIGDKDSDEQAAIEAGITPLNLQKMDFRSAISYIDAQLKQGVI